MTAAALVIDGMATAAGFDYSKLSGDVAAHAKAAAHRIRRQEQRVSESMFEIGRDLIAIKGMLEHGEFIKWVEAECGSAVRTVQNYMKTAEALGAKSATVAYLPPGTLYQLASAPAPARDAIVERIEAGERLSDDAVRDAVWEARQEAKKAKADAKLSPKQRKSRQRRESDKVREHERHQQAARQASAARAQAMAIIREALGDRLSEVAGLLEAGRAEWLVRELRGDE